MLLLQNKNKENTTQVSPKRVVPSLTIIAIFCLETAIALCLYAKCKHGLYGGFQWTSTNQLAVLMMMDRETAKGMLKFVVLLNSGCSCLYRGQDTYKRKIVQM